MQEGGQCRWRTADAEQSGRVHEGPPAGPECPSTGRGQNTSAAPRKRQNGSGFTRHSPPPLPIAPPTPPYNEPQFALCPYTSGASGLNSQRLSLSAASQFVVTLMKRERCSPALRTNRNFVPSATTS